MTGVKTEAELEEMLKSPGGLRDEVARVFKDVAGDLNPVFESQIKGILEKYESDQKALREREIKDAIKDALKTATVKEKRIALAGGSYNPAAIGADQDGLFKDLGEFLTLTRKSWGQPPDARLKAFNETTGGDGGFLVPEEFRAMLMSLAIQEAYIRSRAMVLPMPRGNMRFPTIRDASHASSLFGGVVAYWEPEGTDLSGLESEPTFSQASLLAKKLIGYTVANNEIMNDSAIALEALISRLFPEAINFYEEEAYINGVGSGQPVGFMTSPALIQVTKETGQAAASVYYENIVKMYARMIPSSVKNAIWLYNPEVFPQLATMSLAVGTGGTAVWLNNSNGQNGGAIGAPAATIMGRPAFPSEHCQALGTVGDLIFVDPSYMVIGDTQGLVMASSPHVKFANDQTVWRFTERLDAKPWIEVELTPKYGSNTISPFVALATRS